MEGGSEEGSWVYKHCVRKTQLELNLVNYVKSNGTWCFKCLNSRRKAEEDLRPLLNDTGDLAISDAENVDGLYAFFWFFFCLSAIWFSVWHPRSLSHQNSLWGLEHSREMIQVNELDIEKAVGPDITLQELLRDLVDIIVR